VIVTLLKEIRMSKVMQQAAVAAGAMVLALAVAVPASAQVVHSVSFGGGLFSPRGLDARDADDVLVENLNTLSFDIKDFRGGQVNGEWHVTFSERFEVSLGAGYYSRTTPSVYADFVNNDGSELEQDLRLRMVPITAVVRFLPVGRAGQFQPYLGAGISAVRWRYSETGEFVDFFDNYAVFRDRYVADGTAVVPVVLGGLRLPLGGDVYALNTELRYQFGTGDLGTDNGFLTEKIDLSGLHFTVGFLVRF
jgi:outer membrane protein W